MRSSNITIKLQSHASKSIRYAVNHCVSIFKFSRLSLIRRRAAAELLHFRILFTVQWVKKLGTIFIISGAIQLPKAAIALSAAQQVADVEVAATSLCSAEQASA